MTSPINDSDFYLYIVFLIGAGVCIFQLLSESNQRRTNQFYTTSVSIHRPEDSAARKIIDVRSTNAYICHFSLDSVCFDDLLKEFKKVYPGPCETGRPRSLGSDMVLALVLMWIHSTMKQESLCVMFGVAAATVSRAKRLGLQTLLRIFKNNKNDTRWKISWPTPSKMRTFNQMLHANTTSDFERSVTEGVFGFVDGLNLKIQHPSDPIEQNAYYNGWKGDCYASQVIVFTPDGCICYVRFNCPGSWHDSEISVPLYETLLSDRCPEPYKLLADSAFPCKREFATKILSVPKENAVGVNRGDTETRKKNAVITKHRQAAEWGMRALQGAFARVHLRLSSDKEERQELLSVIFYLHNYRTRSVGLNQIRTVYYERWMLYQESLLIHR